MGEKKDLEIVEIIGLFALGLFSELVLKQYVKQKKKKQEAYEDLGYAVIVEEEKNKNLLT